LDHQAAVAKPIRKRLQQGRTLNFGTWDSGARSWLDTMFKNYFIFPMGAVVKKLTSEWRPTDDHTRTGLNAATILGILAHSIDTYKEIAHYLSRGFCMHVSDVEDAFLLIPLAPWLWPFFFFRFFITSDCHLDLLMHVCADFGTRGAPGTFKLLFVDVFLQMARSEAVLTLPMPVYVDDCALIGACAAAVAAEMLLFQEWAKPFGFFFKVLKDRVAANPQLVIGFWWDSHTFTRTLEETKLAHYLDVLCDFAGRSVLTLNDRQSVAGKMQRAIMTLPPGASCLLSNVYAMTSALSIRWHQRRTNRAERLDYAVVAQLLRLNMGQGYYRFDDFKRLPPLLSDACKGKYVGGGFVDSDGDYDFFQYGTSAARKCIDELEGDTTTVAIDRCGHKWFKCIKPVGIDNKVYERSAARMYSRVSRLDVLVRHQFIMQVRGQFIVEPFWLSTLDNYLADDLSRNREAEFLARLPDSHFLLPGALPNRLPGAGRVRHLPDAVERMGVGGLLHPSGKAYSSDVTGDGPLYVFFLAPRAASIRLRGGGGKSKAPSLESTVVYSRTTLYEGLPIALCDRLDVVMDNRLSESSMASVERARDLWYQVADTEGWDYVIRTDDPERGGKCVAFVLHLLDDTALVFKSIDNYVWGFRTWTKLQKQADPIFGVMQWSDFMDAVEVLSHVPSEPRSGAPDHVLREYFQYLWDRPSFENDQMGFLSVVLYFSFSRSECPCPKAYSGKNVFNRSKHWEVSDFKFCTDESGEVYLVVRFKMVKQDPRMRRLEARGTHGRDPDSGDWVRIGNTRDPIFSVVEWYKRFISHFEGPRDNASPMFQDPVRRTRPLLYGTGLTKVQSVFKEIGYDKQVGFHLLRVNGYFRSRRANGTELTVAHGGWSAHGCHSRYDAFPMHETLSIPSNMLGELSRYDGALAPRTLHREGTSRGERSPDVIVSRDDGGSGDEQVYDVQELLDYRPESDEFLVRWAGYDPSHDTWEPRDNILDEELVDRFHATRARACDPDPDTDEDAPLPLPMEGGANRQCGTSGCTYEFGHMGLCSTDVLPTSRLRRRSA